MTAATEAFGVRELWKVVMKEDGIMQFRSTDKRYLNGSVPGTMVHAKSESITDAGTMFRVHSAADPDAAMPKKRGEYEMEGAGGTLKSMEESYVKKFQSYQDMVRCLRCLCRYLHIHTSGS